MVTITFNNAAFVAAVGASRTFHMQLADKKVLAAGTELTTAEWLSLTNAELADIASMINKGYITVTASGTALTAAQVSAGYLPAGGVGFTPGISADWTSVPVPSDVLDALDELASRVAAGLGT